jgi:hypothetical protein
VKPLIEIQLVQVQPGQSRSGRAGSECCHLPGDWQVRSVHSKVAGRECSAPKSFLRCDADAVSLAEGSIRTAARARLARDRPSPGHASKGISREPRRARCLCRMVGIGPAQPQLDQVRGDEGSPRRKRTTLDEQKPAAKGDRRPQPRADEQSYEPIVPMKVGNRRAPARGGHDTHWREGANR